MKRLHYVLSLLLISAVSHAGLITHSDYTSGTAITAAGQNANENLIFNEFNGSINSANITVGGVATTNIADNAVTNAKLATVITSSITAHTNFASYRRPNLVYISASAVDVENNTSTSNQTCIMFPDGERRCVTEDTSSTDKYRRFIITSTSSYASGTEDSGLRNGTSQIPNQRIAIYAVKSLVDGTKFVLSGDQNFPSLTDASSNNSNYGTNAWVFLGYIFRGTGQSGSSAIQAFTQNGPLLLFTNSVNSGVAQSAGLEYKTSGSVAASTYTYSAGHDNLTIPGSITMCLWHADFSAVAGNAVIKNVAGTNTYYAAPSASAKHGTEIWLVCSEGIALGNGPNSSIDYDILLHGYYDSALANGMAPLF